MRRIGFPSVPVRPRPVSFVLRGRGFPELRDLVRYPLEDLFSFHWAPES